MAVLVVDLPPSPAGAAWRCASCGIGWWWSSACASIALPTGARFRPRSIGAPGGRRDHGDADQWPLSAWRAPGPGEGFDGVRCGRFTAARAAARLPCTAGRWRRRPSRRGCHTRPERSFDERRPPAAPPWRPCRCASIGGLVTGFAAVPGIADRLQRVSQAKFDRARLRGRRGPGDCASTDAALSPGLRQDFQAAGLYHLLAVSGQNVVLVAAGALCPLGSGGEPAGSASLRPWR